MSHANTNTAKLEELVLALRSVDPATCDAAIEAARRTAEFGGEVKQVLGICSGPELGAAADAARVAVELHRIHPRTCQRWIAQGRGVVR